MNSVIQNDITSSWLYKTTLIRPEDRHNLEEIKKYIITTFKKGVNPTISNSILINDERYRTAQNILIILDKILSLLSREDEWMYNIGDALKNISPIRRSHKTLISLLWQKKERYRDNPDLLLRDLDIYNDYYGISESEDIKSQELIDSVNNEVNSMLQQAFDVAIIGTKLSEEEVYKMPNVTEFKIGKIGKISLIQHSETARESTKNIKWLRDKIQEIYEELMDEKR